MKNFFARVCILWSIPAVFAITPHGWAQRQDFETSFSVRSHPEEFLPGWSANEIKSTPSRIFQTPTLGRGGSRALAVQPISSFSGELWIKIKPSELIQPQVEFWARSVQNGSGNRAAAVFFSWGENSVGPFFSRSILGSTDEFPNENQEFRKFTLPVPDAFSNLKEVFLKMEIQQGPGNGTAARWLMDDFELVERVRDISPPRLIQVKGYAKNELQLTFNEALDPVFSLFPQAYLLEEGKTEAVLPINDSTVAVRFNKSFVEGKDYTLRLSQIPDLEGNYLRDTTVRPRFYDPTAPEYKSLVINELMPAPRSDQDLPNVEYIELFNPSTKEFRLKGLVLSNSKTSTDLPEYWIQSGEHLILAPANQSKLFIGFGSVIPVHPWPSLLNSGEILTLSSSITGRIDQLAYTTSSWGGSEFANGGYSLEVVNPFFLCDNSEFLNPSKAPGRGTPGRQNSVFSTETKTSELLLESAYFIQPNRLELVFNQPLIPTIQPEQVSVTPELSVDSIWVSSNGKTVGLKFTKPATPSLVYEIRISRLLSCQGQLMEGILSSTIVLPEEAKPGDLILNEVLFDPKAGDPKFVEIHNLSDRYLSLESWALANLDDGGVPDQIRIFGGKGSFLGPRGFLAISTDTNRLGMSYPKSSGGKFIRIPTLPSFPSAGGTVVLISDKGRIEDRFSYDPSLHHPLIRNTKGVSLERISGQISSAVHSNWQSASAGEDYATPGKQNSMAQLGEFESNLIQIEPQVFDPEGFFGPNFTTIRYELNQPGWIGSFTVYSASGLLVEILAENQLLGNSGLLTWSGTNAAGAKVRTGYYVLVAELFDLNGRVSVIKKTVVVATNL